MDTVKKFGMIRFAEYEDLAAVNELRRQVSELHVKGRPDVFKRASQGSS